jgi:hypothetical protein
MPVSVTFRIAPLGLGFGEIWEATAVADMPDKTNMAAMDNGVLLKSCVADMYHPSLCNFTNNNTE